ncbi:MAG: DUF1800 family protein [Limisphaerales bacterium]
MLEPLKSGRWSESAAAHLLNRAGFGGKPSEIERLRGLGVEGAVARLLDGEGAGDPMPLDPPEWAHPEPDRMEKLRTMRAAGEEERRKMRQAEQREQRLRTEELRGWWLRRMAATPRPFEEKMVLFWHGHFATSVQKVRSPWLMYRQLDLFRTHGLGKWPDLLVEVTRDPAMLIWLDQARSRREHPNENYAREVMELFALGEGHYTEKDILETARALTGLGLNQATQEPEWRPRQHDPGTKTVLGRSGPLGPDEVIRHIARQPQSARHVVSRLWRFFASETAPAGVIEGLAAELEKCGGEIRPVMRKMFLADAFYSPEVVRTQIKSPVQWLVCAFRELERPLQPGATPMITGALRELGQDLLAPPNVKGWDGGVSWINTATLTRRQQLAAVLVDGRAAIAAQAPGERGERMRERMAARSPDRTPGARPVETIFSAEERRDRKRLLAALEGRFLHAPMRSQLGEDVNEVLGDDAVPDPRAIRKAVRVVLEATDYQLT